MSYTNQTQHYGLPQYVATDIPAWLTDFNQSMATIDQGMNAAKTQAESAATAAGQAANDIAALQSTVNTQATQISAAAQAASAAQTTANGADGKADTNAQAITGLDTRVTALEEGGGSSILKYVDFDKPAGNYAVSLEGILPAGAVAVYARWESAVTGAVGTYLSIIEQTNMLNCFLIAASGALNGITVAGRVRLFYIET